MAVIFLTGISAFAQKKKTQEIDYIYPAGGMPGTTFTAIIGGQKLAGINDFTIYLDDQVVGVLDPKEEKKLQEELKILENRQKQVGKLAPADLGKSTRSSMSKARP